MKKILVVVLIIWIVIVFYFSSQPPYQSSVQSGKVYKFLKEVDNILDFTKTEWYSKLRFILEKWWFPEKEPKDLVRKSAHFILYFILGILAFLFAVSRGQNTFFSFLLGFSLPTVVAVLDEYNQGFRGRGSSLYDVVIDMNGALFGVFLSLLVTFLLKILKRKT
ncbi:VanZ family protein [Thermotoga sp. KOL6]|uniref:VanZ family protein n=1 Tax=Thermotoga sp. KOL6 TaxID=126741 RepID=UPI000C775958|nr:VanZ family protein [Thermotoga sp. KOL6]PLV59771.1 hypothetical protein AS005_00260 [Thermotoga sp. KOL6]